MKRKLILIFSVVLAAVLFVACANGDEREEGSYLITSLQIAAHPALDASLEGFKSGLADEGFIVGENLEFRVFNALGDPSNPPLMAAQMVDLEPDLILGIATATSQAVARATYDIPIVITAVTSPYRSGLVDSHENPGGNVTGTTDMTPVALQFDLIMRLFPDTQTVGIMFNAGEENSVIQAEIAREAAAAHGIQLEEMTVAIAADIMQSAEVLARQVDVIYTPTCNLMASGMTAIVRAAEDAGIPVVAGDSGSVQNGALITEGIDYYALGRQTAYMAAQILRGEASPANMPIQSQAEYGYFVNAATARNLNITIPEEILAIATVFEE